MVVAIGDEKVFVVFTCLPSPSLDVTLIMFIISLIKNNPYNFSHFHYPSFALHTLLALHEPQH